MTGNERYNAVNSMRCEMRVCLKSQEMAIKSEKRGEEICLKKEVLMM